MRLGLLTEGGYPYPSGGGRLWCDRLVRALHHHEFEVYALSRSACQHAEGAMGWGGLPAQVRRVRTAALWGDVAEPERRGASRSRGAHCPPGGHGAYAERGTSVRYSPGAAYGPCAACATCGGGAASGAGACCAGHGRGPGGADGAGDSRGGCGTCGSGDPYGHCGSCGVRGAGGGCSSGGGRAGTGEDAECGAHGAHGTQDGCWSGDVRGAQEAYAAYGRRERARFTEHFTALATAISASRGPAGGHGPAPGRPADLGAPTADLGDPSAHPAGPRAQADRFASGLYGLAALARAAGGLPAALRSEQALRILERACHTPGAGRAAHGAKVTDLLIVARSLERLLRPLSLDWYGPYGVAAGAPTRAPGRQPAGAPAPRGTGGRVADGRGLAGVDLCHALSAGPAALPGLLAKRFFGTPLLVTEYGVRLREHFLTHSAATPPEWSGASARSASLPPYTASVRALLAAFHRLLAAETYRQAGLVTAGDHHTRRWQRECGADPDRQRIVHPGMDAECFAVVGAAVEEWRPERSGRPQAPAGPGGRGKRAGAGARAGAATHRRGRPPGADPRPTLLWTGPLEPDKDVCGLLHAFAAIRRSEPTARLRIVAARPGAGPDPGRAATAPGLAPADRWAAGLAPGAGEPPDGDNPLRTAADYAVRCRALAAGLFPGQVADAGATGDEAVSFETDEADAAGESGATGEPAPGDGPGADAGAERRAARYAAADVVVLSSAVEGFPTGLVEAMFCGRATVSTDVGAVREVVGGTGLVVPPGDPRALADACLALLRDPDRRLRLGAAARSRALELFTSEQNTAAFRDIYLDLMAHAPVRHGEAGRAGRPVPFARPAESQVPGGWTSGRRPPWLPGTPVPTSPTSPTGAARVPGWAAGPRRTGRSAGPLAANPAPGPRSSGGPR